MGNAAEPAPPPQPVPRWRRWLGAGRGRWLGVAVGSAFTCALLLPDPGPLPTLRFNAFDAYQTYIPRVRRSAPAVIVAIDEASLARVGPLMLEEPGLVNDLMGRRRVGTG